MPRDITKELVELKQGTHQFIMSMYVILEKLIEEREAKSQIIKVLQDEINYIKSTDESFENTGLTLDELKKIRQALADEINNVRDEHKKFDMVEAYQGLDTFIRYIEN